MIDNTFTLISRIDGEIRRFIMDQLAAEGITDIVPSHGTIIVELMKHGRLSMNELARHIDRTTQTVTCLVKKLVKEGYVETGKGTEDSRVTMAGLTEKGRTLAAILCRISEQIYQIQYSGIAKGDIRILRSSLMQMYENFSEREDAKEGRRA